jgi:hypothetical protein
MRTAKERKIADEILCFKVSWLRSINLIMLMTLLFVLFAMENSLALRNVALRCTMGQTTSLQLGSLRG